MWHIHSPRRWTAHLAAGVLAAGMLVVLPGAASSAPAAVRLAPDGAGVRSAEISVEPGLTRLRTATYSMVAATWRGPAPRVTIRPSGGRWERLPLLHDGPDGGEATGRSGSDLVWTGPQRGIEVRVRGDRARDLELVLIDPGESSTTTTTRARPGTLARSDDSRAPRPAMRSRKDWGANGSWRNGRPRYLDRMKQVHLHHTATGNDYRRTDVPGIIRGMYRYHTQSLGWFDLGYNFLVDKYGRTWVGRSGGPARLVQGAHTLGFNHASVGVAVIGNFESQGPRDRVLHALKRLAAWKYDKHGRNARRQVFVRSTGSDKYPEGRRAKLPAFDGHRDTNDTACPGERLYAKLPRLRRMTQRRIDRFS